MRILMDTHILLWALIDSPKIAGARALLEDPSNEVFFSAASIFEVAIKHVAGKLSADPVVVAEAAAAMQFTELPMTATHGAAIKTLKKPEALDHKDPFDRMLLAQAKCEGLVLATADKKILAYDEPYLLRI